MGRANHQRDVQELGIERLAVADESTLAEMFTVIGEKDHDRAAPARRRPVEKSGETPVEASNGGVIQRLFPHLQFEKCIVPRRHAGAAIRLEVRGLVRVHEVQH